MREQKNKIAYQQYLRQIQNTPFNHFQDLESIQNLLEKEYVQKNRFDRIMGKILNHKLYDQFARQKPKKKHQKSLEIDSMHDILRKMTQQDNKLPKIQPKKIIIEDPFKEQKLQIKKQRYSQKYIPSNLDTDTSRKLKMILENEQDTLIIKQQKKHSFIHKQQLFPTQSLPAIKKHKKINNQNFQDKKKSIYKKVRKQQNILLNQIKVSKFNRKSQKSISRNFDQILLNFNK